MDGGSFLCLTSVIVFFGVPVEAADIVLCMKTIDE